MTPILTPGVIGMNQPVSDLTERDRQTIARARELADIKGTDAIRNYADEDDPYFAVTAAFGTAQELLWQLARIAERRDDHAMLDGEVLKPGPLDLVHRHPDIPVMVPRRGARWLP